MSKQAQLRMAVCLPVCPFAYVRKYTHVYQSVRSPFDVRTYVQIRTHVCMRVRMSVCVVHACILYCIYIYYTEEL